MIYITKYVIINKELGKKLNLVKEQKSFHKKSTKNNKNVLTLWKQYVIIINVLSLNLSTQFCEDKLV